MMIFIVGGGGAGVFGRAEWCGEGVIIAVFSLYWFLYAPRASTISFYSSLPLSSDVVVVDVGLITINVDTCAVFECDGEWVY